MIAVKPKNLVSPGVPLVQLEKVQEDFKDFYY